MVILFRQFFFDDVILYDNFIIRYIYYIYIFYLNQQFIYQYLFIKTIIMDFIIFLTLTNYTIHNFHSIFAIESVWPHCSKNFSLILTCFLKKWFYISNLKFDYIKMLAIGFNLPFTNLNICNKIIAQNLLQPLCYLFT